MSKQFSKKSRIIQTAVISFILLLIVLTIFVYSSNNAFTRGTAKVLPYPAAFVGGHEVTVRSYYEMSDIAAKASGRALNKSESAEVLDKAIDNKVVVQEAGKRGLSLSADDINKYHSYLQGLTGKQQLGKDYGLAEEEFTKIVVIPDITSIKLQQKLSQDKLLNPDAYSKLDKVKSALSAGLSLETAAQQYSDDKGSGRIGGDIGFVGSADVVPEFYDDISKVQDESVHVFVSRYGIHVYKIFGKDNLGQNGTSRYRIKQVFIRTIDFNSWLQKARSGYSIVKIIR